MNADGSLDIFIQGHRLCKSVRRGLERVVKVRRGRAWTF